MFVTNVLPLSGQQGHAVLLAPWWAMNNKKHKGKRRAARAKNVLRHDTVEAFHPLSSYYEFVDGFLHVSERRPPAGI